jgi:phosphohistidine phosphatase
MRHVWLLRHAKSSWDDGSLADEDRPLAPRGARAAAAMATYLASADVHPQLVLCSSGLRARQTLSAVLISLGTELDVRIERGLYTFDAAVVLERLRRVDDAVTSVLVVGHNPALQDLALRLGSGGPARPDVEEKLPTGTLILLDVPTDSWASLGEVDAAISRFVSPRSLEAPA